MTTLDATLAELAELERRATPGPWRSMRDGNQYIDTQRITPTCVGASRIDEIIRPWNPHALIIAFGFKPKEYETARFLDADADLIAAARNALPAILSDRARLVKERDEARAVTERLANERINAIADKHAAIDERDTAIADLAKLREAANAVRYGSIPHDYGDGPMLHVTPLLFDRLVAALRALDGES